MTMAQFLKKVLLFTVAFLVFEKVSYFLLAMAPSSLYDNRVGLVLEGKVNKDVIVMGSSRGMRGVIASQIVDSTGLSAYNLCHVGADLAFQAFMLRTLVKFNDTPKVVMLVVDDPIQLWDHEMYNFRSDLLVPYTQYHYITDELIRRDLRHPIARYVFTARLSQRNFNLEIDPDDLKDGMWGCGSKPLDAYGREQDYAKYDFAYDPSKELPWKIVALRKIERFCERNGIQFILVYPPNFKVFNQDFVDRLRFFASPSTLHCVYDHTNPAYDDTRRFFDADHLHISGARIFTNELIAFLRGLDL